MPRNDIHRPALLDPAEYEFVAAFYQGTSDDIAWSYRDEHSVYTEAIEGNESGTPGTVFDGNFSLKATCDHCGAAFAHGVLFKHLPTSELIHVGHICASNTVGLPSRAVAVRKSAERHAREENERRERMEATAAWREANADLVAFLQADGEEHTDNFYRSLAQALHKYGNLSERQAEALRQSIARNVARDAQRAERIAAAAARTEDAPPIETGRRAITGTIISTKIKHDEVYGDTLKMLVEEENGNRVYGTCPRSLEDLTFSRIGPDNVVTEGIELPGQKVTFTAAVEASRDDEHFGFYKRPASARLA